MATHAGDAFLIQLGNMVFNVGVPASGIMWVGSLTGWDSAAVRPLAIGGELTDGDHWQPGFYGARQMTLTGYGTLFGAGNDIGSLRAARERVVAATQIVGTLARLRVSELIGGSLVVREVDVYTTDRPEVIIQGCTVRFSVGLAAPDARKYSTTMGTATLVDTLPSVRNAVAAGGFSASAILPVPTGTTTGDVMWVWLELDSATVSAAPAGWSLFASASFTGGNAYVYRRAAGGAEPASYTWTLSGADEWVGATVTVRNSDSSLLGANSQLATSVATDLIWPITTPAPRALRLFGAGYSLLSAYLVPAPLFVVTNANIGSGATAAAVLVASAARASGLPDATPVTVQITPQRTNFAVQVNPPPLVGPSMLTIAGTAFTPPVLTVAGPSAAGAPLVICNRNQCVQFDVQVVSGQVLVADFRTRTVTINGVNRYDVVHPASSWWELTPGLNLMETLGASLENFPVAAGIWRFELGTGGLGISRQVSEDGSASLEITSGIAGNIQVRSMSPAGVAVGTTYAATLSMRPGSTTRTVIAQIAWLGTDGAAVSVSSGTPVAEVAGVFTAATVSAAAPAGAITAVVQVQINSAAIGERHYLDRAGLYVTALPATYDERQANAIDYSGGGTAVLSWTEADW